MLTTNPFDQTNQKTKIGFIPSLTFFTSSRTSKMSQARTRIRIRGEGVLQDGTRYSRELSVIETLETDGSTKETSEETIKIGQEKVCFVIFDHIMDILTTFLQFYVFHMKVVVDGERIDGNSVREQVQVAISLIFFGNFSNFQKFKSLNFAFPRTGV